MLNWSLSATMAHGIVTRTMSILGNIIDTNINVMDASGYIIASSDSGRIGELHEGALLVISQGRVVDIDAAVSRHLYGVRQGINLPLHLDGEIVGVIGMSGEPDTLRKYGELVCMTAEMMLEQSRMLHMLAKDSRFRQEFVLNLIQSEEYNPALDEFAKRLGIDIKLPRVVAIIEVDSDQLSVESAMERLQQLQNELVSHENDNLVAIVSLTELVVLMPALNPLGKWDLEIHRKRAEKFISKMKGNGLLGFQYSLGNYDIEQGGIARSYQTARTTMAVGKQRMPDARSYFYQDMMLPVLLNGLHGGWQSNEFVRILSEIKAADNHGQLRKTLQTWFQHNLQSLATSKALFIHRNTLEYRLSKIEGITGLDLNSFDDKLFLYIALQLDLNLVKK